MLALVEPDGRFGAEASCLLDEVAGDQQSAGDGVFAVLDSSIRSVTITST